MASKSWLAWLDVGCMSSLHQCACANSSGMGRPCLIYYDISYAQDNQCVRLRIHPHAVESTPTTPTRLALAKILSNAIIVMFPQSSLNLIDFKLCYTTLLHILNDALMDVCCSSSKL